MEFILYHRWGGMRRSRSCFLHSKVENFIKKDSGLMVMTPGVLCHQSMNGYFEHVGNKTYIDRYPASIINLKELENAKIIEFGSGTCSDANYLINSLGIAPINLFLMECDMYYLTKGVDKLEGCDTCLFFDSGMYNCTDDTEHCRVLPNIIPRDILDNHFPDRFADFVYANNFLHSLGYPYMGYYGTGFEPKDKIRRVIGEAYRLLKTDGVFFGRTLSDRINTEKLKKLSIQHGLSRKEKFCLRTVDALSRKELIGLACEELVGYGINTGFSIIYIEITVSDWSPISDIYFRFEMA